MDTKSLAARAWNAVKEPSQPDYEHCAGDWKRTLRTHAESILRGDALSTLDSPLARFEAKVKELMDEPPTGSLSVEEVFDVFNEGKPPTDNPGPVLDTLKDSPPLVKVKSKKTAAKKTTTKKAATKKSTKKAAKKSSR